MIKIRASNRRGHTKLDWLDSRHTFSFGEYHDPEHAGFRTLRVINQDGVAPGQGFPAHSHRDMEIISYVLEGALRHQDSLGTSSVIRPGEVQRMSAGTGVRHSEYNFSGEDSLHLLQIWIRPKWAGQAPGYAQKVFAETEKKNRLRLIVSPDAREGSIGIRQDAFIFDSSLDAGKALKHEAAPDRGVWIQMIKGMLEVSGLALENGDGAAIEGEPHLELAAKQEAHFILFDLP